MVVSPYHSGEVIVQNYNAVLTLGHLATASNAVLVLENEHVSPSPSSPARVDAAG